jgi:hypothetical protein
MVKHLRVFSVIVFLVLVVGTGAFAGEMLYNGIELPEQWPPDDGEPSGEPMRIPYLATRQQLSA